MASMTRVLEMLAVGKTFQQVATALKLRRWQVANMVRRYEDEHGPTPRPGRGNPQVIQQYELEQRDDTSGERCRCGLRLPCNDCIQPLWMFATDRRDRA